MLSSTTSMVKDKDSTPQTKSLLLLELLNLEPMKCILKKKIKKSERKIW